MGGATNNPQKWNFEKVEDVPGEPGTPIHESWFFKRLSDYSIEEIEAKLKDRFYRKFTFGRDKNLIFEIIGNLQHQSILNS